MVVSIKGDEVPSRYFADFEKSLPKLAGMTVAITGTTSGTGYIAAVACAKKGAEVIVLNRESGRLAESLEKMRKEANGGKISSISCDLQNFASVRKAAAELKEKCGERGLDVFACNAGIMAFPNKATIDGFDVQMQTNQVSHFLLVKEVLPLLKTVAEQKGEARIVICSSRARLGEPLEAKFFGPSGAPLENTTPRQRYHHSKLANVLFAHALTTKLSAAGLSKIKAVTAAPGVALTALVNNSESWEMPNVPRCLWGYFLQSPEDGTMPLLTAMLMPGVRSADFVLPSKGAFCSGETRGPVRTIRAPLPAEETHCADPKAQEMLWAECERAIQEPFTI